jgi:hypothetical protein|tara:strand:- start:33 stop:479 length:447 start_codon:yes stop_codon:yes gene_type:complete
MTTEEMEYEPATNLYYNNPYSLQIELEAFETELFKISPTKDKKKTVSTPTSLNKSKRKRTLISVTPASTTGPSTLQRPQSQSFIARLESDLRPNEVTPNINGTEEERGRQIIRLGLPPLYPRYSDTHGSEQLKSLTDVDKGISKAYEC